MKSNTAVAAVLSIAAMLLFVGLQLIGYAFEADAIAPDLASRIGVDEDTLREHLECVLKKGRLGRAVIYGTPWAVIAAVFVAKLIAEARDHSATAVTEILVEREDSEGSIAD